MNDWTVTTLRLGELYLPEGGGIMRDPVHCWLVRGEAATLLVDSGMADIPVIEQRLKVSGIGGGHTALIKALAAEGLTPDDITHVVLTHMHFDHAENLDLFPNACVVVQRDEFLASVDPVPSQRIFYWKSTINNLLERKRPAGLRLVDGDVDLFPGVRLLRVSAHTEGMQVVVVTTAKGRVALACDFIVASESASFIQVFAKVGLVPDLGGLYLLSRVVGLNVAKELCFTARKVLPDEAKALGIVNHVVPHDLLMAKARELAGQIVKASPTATAMTKNLLNKSSNSTLDQMLEFESFAQTVAYLTPEYKEGVAAFREKRTPDFAAAAERG